MLLSATGGVADWRTRVHFPHVALEVLDEARNPVAVEQLTLRAVAATGPLHVVYDARKPLSKRVDADGQRWEFELGVAADRASLKGAGGKAKDCKLRLEGAQATYQGRPFALAAEDMFPPFTVRFGNELVTGIVLKGLEAQATGPHELVVGASLPEFKLELEREKGTTNGPSFVEGDTGDHCVQVELRPQRAATRGRAAAAAPPLRPIALERSESGALFSLPQDDGDWVRGGQMVRVGTYKVVATFTETRREVAAALRVLGLATEATFEQELLTVDVRAGPPAKLVFAADSPTPPPKVPPSPDDTLECDNAKRVVHTGIVLCLRDAYDQPAAPPSTQLAVRALLEPAQGTAAAVDTSVARFGADGLATLPLLKLNAESPNLPGADVSALTLRFELHPPIPGVALPASLEVRYSDRVSLDAANERAKEEGRKEEERRKADQMAAERKLQDLSDKHDYVIWQLGDEQKKGKEKAKRLSRLMAATRDSCGPLDAWARRHRVQPEAQPDHLRALLSGGLTQLHTVLSEGFTALQSAAGADALGALPRQLQMLGQVVGSAPTTSAPLAAHSGLRDNETNFVQSLPDEALGFVGVIAELFVVSSVGAMAFSQKLAGVLTTMAGRDVFHPTLLVDNHAAAQRVSAKARERHLKLSYRYVPAGGQGRTGPPPSVQGVEWAEYARNLLMPDPLLHVDKQRRISPMVEGWMHDTVVVTNEQQAHCYMAGARPKPGRVVALDGFDLSGKGYSERDDRRLNVRADNSRPHFGVAHCAEYSQFLVSTRQLHDEAQGVSSWFDSWRRGLEKCAAEAAALRQNAQQEFDRTLPLPKTSPPRRVSKRRADETDAPEGRQRGECSLGMRHEELD